MQSSQAVTFAVRALTNQIKRRMNYISACDHPHHHHCQHLTGMHYGIISYLGVCTEQDIYQRDIEQVFNIRRSTASGILQLLEQRGYLLRQSVEHDARLKKLVLTPQALALHCQMSQRLDQVEGELTKGIAENELLIFLRLAQQMTDNLK